MDVLPVLGSSFFVFFPVVVALLVAAFSFRVHARLLRLFGASLDPTSSDAAAQADHGSDAASAVAEGVALIQDRKRALDAAVVHR